MGRREKQLAALRNSARGWRYDELRNILLAFGFTTENKGGSHRTFKHSCGVRVVLPDHGSGAMLPVYPREVLKAIDSIPPETPDDAE